MKTSTRKPDCNMPDCDEPAVARGLCKRHYAHLASGGPETKARAEKYAVAADPRLGGRRKKKPKSSKRPGLNPPSGPAPASTVTAAERSEAADAAATKRDDAITRVLTEFATAMGIKHMPYENGHVFFTPNGRHRVFHSGGGVLRDFEFRIHTAK